MLQPQVALQHFLFSAMLQYFSNGRQPEPHILQGIDFPGNGELTFMIVPVTGIGIDFHGVQQSQLVIVAQHSDTDSG